MANVIYKLHPRHADKKVLATFVNGRAVNLTGKPATRVHEATPTAAQWTETIPAATQEDLKAVYERGDCDAERFPIVIAETAVKQDDKGK